MDEQFNVIVAGAGIWGCTVARRLAEAGKKVMVLESRPVVGGNVRCDIDPLTGIEIHKYGSHIFHTHIPEVWEFVNRFASFNGYQHKVLANYKGRTYHLPLGLALINKFFGIELRPSEVEAFMKDETHRRAIFDVFFRGYTSKQWGKAPEEIDPTIIKRVPVRSNYDTNYFNDYWQGIPSEGYNAFFDRLLEHPNVTVKTSSSLRLKFRNGDSEFVLVDEKTREETPLCNNNAPRQLYYSGPIDALFSYKYGALPWRTLRFELERVAVADYQGTAVVNYTEASVPYTRIHEFKHYHPEPMGPLSQAEGIKTGKETIVMREYSAQWTPGDEPYYPIDSAESHALMLKYRWEMERLNQAQDDYKLIVGGRLGEYKYYDMDKSIESALRLDVE